MEAVKFRKYFGEALADQRKSANLSRQALADVLAVDRSTIFRWETGEKWPSDSDAVVAIYERETKVSALDLWRDAIRRADEADAKGELERFLTEDRPSVEELDAASAARVDLPPADADPDSR